MGHEDKKEQRREAFKKAREESEKNRKEYTAMTPTEKIKANLDGIKKELAYKGIDITCMCQRVYCIECAICEIQNNLEHLQNKPKAD